MREEEKQAHYRRAEQLLGEQNFPAALAAGALSACVAAVLCGTVGRSLGLGYGFALAGVGIVVSLPMGFLGRGILPKFGVAAGACAVIGCALSVIVQAVLDMPKVNSGSVADTLRYYPLGEILERAANNAAFGDLIYWLIAVFCAVFLAKRPLSRADRLALGVFAQSTQRGDR